MNKVALSIQNSNDNKNSSLKEASQANIILEMIRV